MLVIAIPGVDAAGEAPSSCSCVLDTAAKVLAKGQLDAAGKGFETVAKDTSAPAFVRGLALLGLAQTATVRGGAAAANPAWQRLAADPTVPALYRDTAKRWIMEAHRQNQSLPRRDPAACQAQLPSLPEPAVVFHVAPMGSDKNEGSEARPFRTLARARDAVRALKKSRGGALAKGGARVLIAGGEYYAGQPLMLMSEDSGTAEAPVVYQAKPGQTPIFRGGIRITRWRPITDAKLRNKLVFNCVSLR